MKESRKNKRYSAELKIEVAKSYLSGEYGGMSSVAKKYDLKTKRVEDWVKIYRCNGPTGFLIERRGRNSKGGGRSKTVKLEEMTLEQQVEYLKMENDILKKVQALLKD